MCFLNMTMTSNRILLIFICVFALLSYVKCINKQVNLETKQKYEPNWKSLDARPLPQWYDNAKIGIFIHWGVFSVPSFGSEWFWNFWKTKKYAEYVEYMNKNFPKGFTYQEFAKDFSAEFFNPDTWATLFKKSGAKYVVLTSKHHEGFTMWPSTSSFSWNAKDIGPHRDLVGDLSEAVRKTGLVFGLYYSLFEWYNPIYLSDEATNFTKTEYVNNKVKTEMTELINKYKPEVYWSDGEAVAYDTYWNSTEFLAWLYNESPVKDTVVVNDRWGIGTACKHGGFYSCADRYNPGTLQPHKWENAMTLDKKSWGFRRNASLQDYLTIHELLSMLAQTISCGGNILINIGPTKEGIIAPIFEERLLELGQWLEINGDAIYSSTPWTSQNDSLASGVWYTSKSSEVYAIVLDWPNNNRLYLKSVAEYFKDKTVQLTMLGEKDILKWQLTPSNEVAIDFPNKSMVQSKHAWVLKMKGTSSQLL